MLPLKPQVKQLRGVSEDPKENVGEEFFSIPNGFPSQGENLRYFSKITNLNFQPIRPNQDQLRTNLAQLSHYNDLLMIRIIFLSDCDQLRLSTMILNFCPIQTQFEPINAKLGTNFTQLGHHYDLKMIRIIFMNDCDQLRLSTTILNFNFLGSQLDPINAKLRDVLGKFRS